MNTKIIFWVSSILETYNIHINYYLSKNKYAKYFMAYKLHVEDTAQIHTQYYMIYIINQTKKQALIYNGGQQLLYNNA